MLHSGDGGLSQVLVFSRLLKPFQLPQQGSLPQTERPGLSLLLKASLLVDQSSVSILQPPQQDRHHVQTGGRGSVSGDGEPGPLQEQVQLRGLVFETVDALSDQRQLGPTVLQNHRVAAGTSLDSGHVLLHGAQGHEETVQGASGCLALPDLLSELVQTGSVGLHLPSQREEFSGVKDAGFRVQSGQLVQLTLNVVIQFL